MTKVNITVVKHGNLEIVSGDGSGCIFVWWIQSKEIIQKCKAHNGAVLDLQFDATKIVSCGTDKDIKIIDIISGDVLQTLRGHDKPVISIAFDNDLILSLSQDQTLRKWYWSSCSLSQSNSAAMNYTMKSKERE